MINLEQLEVLLTSRESEHFECKEAKNRYDFEKLVEYCVALANEGGGKMVLGVTDHVPHKVVGSQAFPNPESTAAAIGDRIHLKIVGYELQHANGRVVLFEVPSRPKGLPIPDKGRYLMRSGNTLAPMGPDRLKQILDELSWISARKCVPEL